MSTGAWAVWAYDGSRWRQTPHRGLSFHGARALAIWYRDRYGGDWCANTL